MEIILILKTLILGIVEGLTEFFPVSSTAHLLITERLLKLPADPFIKTLTVAIQSGAMIAVVIFFWKTIWKNLSLIPKLAVAFIPTAIVGLLLIGFINKLLGASIYIAIMLILGGVVFLFLRTNDTPTTPITNITYKEAVWIGIAQILSIIPGVSRSGATLIGGSLVNIAREHIVQFSFLLAIPTIFGATVVELHHAPHLSGGNWALILFGTLVATIVSLLTMKWALRLTTKKPLRYFGWYRIAVGLLLIIILVM